MTPPRIGSPPVPPRVAVPTPVPPRTAPASQPAATPPQAPPVGGDQFGTTAGTVPQRREVAPTVPQPSTLAPALAQQVQAARVQSLATGGANVMATGAPVSQTPTNLPGPMLESPQRTRGGLPLAAQPNSLGTNTMGLTAGVGPGQPNHVADVQLIQHRLAELDLFHGPQNGEFTPDTQHALQDFQHGHAADIRTIAQDGRSEPMAHSQFARSTQSHVGNGSLVPGDATHQALCQAWPHRVGGRLMDEAQAYNYYAGQVRERGLPFDASQTQVVGVRGYQDGVAHAQSRSGLSNNRYDDTMVMLAHDAAGRPLVREFRATVDPGGVSTSALDRVGFSVDAGQQSTFRLASREGEHAHAGRPGLVWQARGGADTAAAHQTTLTAHATGSDAAISANGRAMIHSGSAGEDVATSSRGCQVVNGNWYPAFFGGLERAAGAGGTVRYTLLDGQDLTPGTVQP